MSLGKIDHIIHFDFHFDGHYRDFGLAYKLDTRFDFDFHQGYGFHRDFGFRCDFYFHCDCDSRRWLGLGYDIDYDLRYR